MTDHPPDTPRVLTCHDTADFLAALPLFTGFTADDSLFIVLFAQGQAGRALRVDLPPPDIPAETAHLLDLVCDILRTNGAVADPAAAPAIVICCSQSFAEAGGAPWHRLARRIERRLRRERIGVRELCCLAPDGWVSYLDPGAPRGGRPLSDIATSPIALEASVHGTRIPRLSELGEIPRPVPARARAVARSLAAVAPLTQPGPAEPSGRAPSADRAGADRHPVPTWFHDTAVVTRALCDSGPELSAGMTARIIRSAAHPDRWLLIALGILTRPEFPSELARDLSARPFTGVAVDLDADPAAAPRPGWSIRRVLAAISPEFTDHRRLHPIRERLLTAIAETPPDERPALLALSSWIWWLSGNQTVAHRHVRAALSTSSEHEIARMVERIVEVPLYAGLLARSARRAA